MLNRILCVFFASDMHVIYSKGKSCPPYMTELCFDQAHGNLCIGCAAFVPRRQGME